MNNENNSQEILNLIQNIQSKLNMENNSTNQDQINQETNDNFQNSEINNTQIPNNNNNTNNNNSTNNLLNNIDLGSILSMFGQNTSNNNSSSSSGFDPSMLTKFQRIFNNINADNPKRTLLLSLKPFLRKNRQDKIGEYITMLTIADAIGIFNRKGSDNNV